VNVIRELSTACPREGEGEEEGKPHDNNEGGDEDGRKRSEGSQQLWRIQLESYQWKEDDFKERNLECIAANRETPEELK